MTKRRKRTGAGEDRKDLAIALIVSGAGSQIAIANRLGIRPERISRWRSEPEFAAKLAAAKAEAKETVFERLKAGAPMALDTLEEVMLDRRAPRAPRVAAAARWLRLAGFEPQVHVDVVSGGQPLPAPQAVTADLIAEALVLVDQKRKDGTE